MTITPKPLINSQYAPSSAGTVYTTPSNTNTIIDKFTATNDTAGPITITIYIVPSGGSAGNSNMLVSVFSIAANTIKDFTELQNQILTAGDFISLFASAGSSIVVRASGREVILP